MQDEKRKTIQTTLFDYFAESDSFSLKEAEQITKKVLNKEVKIPSIRARIYEGIDKGIFERISKGVYRTRSSEGTECLLINGNGRDLSMLKDNSKDAIITDHPYDIKTSHKGGNRNFVDYDSFQYNEHDFKEKCRVLKDGCFLVEFLPEENSSNWEYLADIKTFAKKQGLNYYAKVSWIKGNQVNNTGRKASNSEEILFFSKGRARELRLDQKKNLAELRNAGIEVKNKTSQEVKTLLEKNDLPVHYMSGTNGMLPTSFVFEPPNKKERIHQAEKPVELYKEIEQYITNKCEWVLDQFAGSFNLAKASLKSNRNSISIELDSEYMQKAIQTLKEEGYEFDSINENTQEFGRLVYTDTTINFANVEREIAILIMDDNLYEDVNHQYALERAFNDEGESLEMDLDDPIEIDKIADMTHSSFEDENQTIYGFDIYNHDGRKYLTSHFPHNLENCYLKMKEYAEENNLIMCTFTDFETSEAVVIDIEKTNQNYMTSHNELNYEMSM